MNKFSAWVAEAEGIAAAFRLGAALQVGEPMANLIRQVAQAVGSAPSSRKDDLSWILEELLACHKRDDWLGVADYLEFELVDWLTRFSAEVDMQTKGADRVHEENFGSAMASTGSGQGGPTEEGGVASLSENSRNSC